MSEGPPAVEMFTWREKVRQTIGDILLRASLELGVHYDHSGSVYATLQDVKARDQVVAEAEAYVAQLSGWPELSQDE